MLEPTKHYRLACFSVVLGVITATCVLLLTRMTIPPETATAMVGIPGFLILLHFRYRRLSPDIRLDLLCGSLAIIITASLTAGIIAHAGMRFRMPLQDRLFAAIDQAFGLDTPALVIAFNELPRLANALPYFYNSTVQAVFVTAMYLSVTSQAQKVWELALGFSASIVVFSIISVFAPAHANFVNAGLVGDKIGGLPTGSGIFHMASVSYYRDGLSPIVDINNFTGVVTFPSFHMVMAIIVAYAWRDTAILRRISFLWAVVVAVSTIPIGGHYVVDLVAGAFFWVLVMRLADHTS